MYLKLLLVCGLGSTLLAKSNQPEKKEPAKKPQAVVAAKANPKAEPVAKTGPEALAKTGQEAAFSELFQQVKLADSLSLSFEQLVFKSLRKTNQKKFGRAYFQRPFKFRWAIDKPQASEWLYNGKELVSFDPNTKQGVSYSAEGDKSKNLREIVELILHPEQIEKAYKILSLNKDKKSATLLLAPKATSEIEKAELVFDLEQTFVKELKLFFNSKNETTFKFVKLSEKPSNDLFVLPKDLVLRTVF